MDLPQLLWLYALLLHIPLDSHPEVSAHLFLLKIAPLLSSSSLVNLLDISAMTNYPLRSFCSHPLCYVWYDSISPIRYGCSDLTQFDIIFSLLFYPLNLLFYDSLYSDHSNPIQYARSLFSALLSPLRLSELLVLLKITYHLDPSNHIITCTKGYK